MSIFLISTLVLGISFFILGLLLRKDGKKLSKPMNNSHGLIGIYLGSFIFILGIAYTFLYKNAWTDDNKQLFLYIILSVALLFSLLYSFSMVLNALKSSSKIGLINSSFWALSFSFIGLIGFLSVNKMNKGWTKEKETAIKNRCKSEGKYDCDCMLELIKTKYINPEDYNSLMENETENRLNIDALKTVLVDKCLKCDSIKMGAETLVIGEELPD